MTEAVAETVRVAPRDDPWPPARQAWYAVIIFALSLTINFLDRGILTLLVQPIKEDLQLSDTQMGFVMGFAFVFLYMLIGLPIARLVDSKSRRFIIGFGLVMWSGMTALTGLAQSFWQLFIVRVGVGVGEACTGPATYSMMADLFPRDKLPRAIAVLNFGFVLGNGGAMLIAGTVIHLLASVPEISLPGFGTLKAWQMTFIAVGLPGLIVAALMGTVKEPKRRGLIAPGGATDGAPPKALSVGEVIGFLGNNWKVYGPMFLGLALKGVLNVGVTSWVPTMFIRSFGWTQTKIGLVMGSMLLVIAPLGLMAGTFLSEKLTRKGYADANIRVVVLASLFVVPISVIYPLLPAPELMLALMGINLFVQFLIPAPQNAALQIVTPNQMRGQVTALFLFIFNVIGFGLGPLVVPLLTDYVFKSEDLLNYSISSLSGTLGPLAVLVLWWGMKHYGQAVIRSREWD